MSLIEAQANFAAFGATERRLLPHVRAAREDEPLDPGWRPYDPVRDGPEPADDGKPPPSLDDRTKLYWWRSG